MTPEKAAEQQLERWQRLSLEERFRIVAAMIEDGFALVAASIRAAHPVLARAATVEKYPAFCSPAATCPSSATRNRLPAGREYGRMP
jgi:hypothetical protein